MSAGNFYAVTQALARENDTTDRAVGVTEGPQRSAQAIVEGMTIFEAREALLFADTSIRGYEESKVRAIEARKFIKEQLFREVE